jgi:hypothetical protein
MYHLSGYLNSAQSPCSLCLCGDGFFLTAETERSSGNAEVISLMQIPCYF